MADRTSRIKEAQKLLAKGQIDKALGEWEKIVKDYPDGNNFNFIGDLYLKKGDKKNAAESFHKAANFFRQEGFSLKALALFKKVLNVNPADAAALYTLGELSEEKALITDAIKYYLASADSLAKEGKKDELFDIYQKILSLSPSNIPLRNKVAEILFKEGLKSDAAKEYLLIAGIYDEKGDTDKSKEYYQRTIDIQPLNKEAVIGLSCLHEKTGAIDKAIDLMKEATVLFHEDVDVLLRAADISLIGNHPEDAKSYLSRVNDLEHNNAKARRLLGELYLKEGLQEQAWEEYLVVLDDMILEEKYADAIKILESFKKVVPIETGKRLVVLYKQLGEEPHLVEELILLGDVYYDGGMRDEALACYIEAAEIAPDNDHLHERIAELKGRPSPGAPDFTGLGTTTEFREPAERKISEHISIKAEKTVDEIFTEAGIFSRYGLLGEAQKLLEGLKLRIPEDIDLHLRLKAVYTDLEDKESAVTECLILSELYKRSNDTTNSEKILNEAFGISPSDPRLAEKGFADRLETTSFASKDVEEFMGTSAGEKPPIEDYEEELAEADFYARQGLVQEALKILLKLQGVFPENQDVAERLEALGEGAGMSSPQQMPEPQETSETPFEYSADKAPPGTLFTEESPAGEEILGDEFSVTEQKGIEKSLEKEGVAETPEEEPEAIEYEDFSISEDDFVEAQAMPEPTLDNDVLEIFQEFKKGLANQLEDEDSETHYNLGIAYKEMGLIDDAIKEFQTSQKDKKRSLQSSSMLGVCYMEKGLYSLAIDVLSKTLDSLGKQDDSYWSIKFELAEAYEKNHALKTSLDLYTEVYGWNAKFRDVAERISLLATQVVKTVGKEKLKERKDRVSYL